MPHILTLNAGSSSIKFALFEAGSLNERVRGQIEAIGTKPHLSARIANAEKTETDLDAAEVSDHAAALAAILALMEDRFSGADVKAVGHRIVHGGPDYGSPVIIDEDCLANLEKLIPLAPLHQPHNLSGVRAAQAAFPDATQVACFDTAFHRQHPWVNDTYALPLELYEEGIRRYGFHGLSYEYVTRALRQLAPMHAAGRVVVSHLGNGASMCAIQGGQSVGSTMGFTALDGLPMGTRCGQLDPGVVLYLMAEKGLTAAEIENLLYKQSGLKGLSGLSNDMRALEEAGTIEARRAIDYFVYRIRRELGAMVAILSGLDALVFCGGIGENAWRIRERVCQDFGWLGLELDESQNRAGETIISSQRSRVRVFIIRTNEELMIASHAAEKAQEAIASAAAA
ncbi:acetate/propionate family kinase [Methyloceanibacter caenitepidi]|uniref:Acetate kinase n=1 Tax=Methyloceanibacter caenitepidi TaxID=1384459 RepID=A0A0A8JZL1_9HYPH|nr:acetate kinase [Methyloceanibacter caenitepidi]BAQ15851.1 acetate kinase [Methyloceanibacter caenitepidi]